jgi:hypothetical protein
MNNCNHEVCLAAHFATVFLLVEYFLQSKMSFLLNCGLVLNGCSLWSCGTWQRTGA